MIQISHVRYDGEAGTPAPVCTELNGFTTCTKIHVYRSEDDPVQDCSPDSMKKDLFNWDAELSMDTVNSTPSVVIFTGVGSYYKQRSHPAPPYIIIEDYDDMPFTATYYAEDDTWELEINHPDDGQTTLIPADEIFTKDGGDRLVIVYDRCCLINGNTCSALTSERNAYEVIERMESIPRV